MLKRDIYKNTYFTVVQSIIFMDSQRDQEKKIADTKHSLQTQLLCNNSPGSPTTSNTVHIQLSDTHFCHYQITQVSQPFHINIHIPQEFL